MVDVRKSALPIGKAFLEHFKPLLEKLIVCIKAKTT